MMPTQSLHDSESNSSHFQPLVSVIVLNYNHLELVRQCLRHVLALEWTLLEVIVVDNASSDGSADAIEREFGDRVRLIRRSVNSPTAGRNEGFNSASGQYVLSIDNDIVLLDKGVVRKAIAVFEQLPNVGVLAFKIGTVENPAEPIREHWWYSLPIEDWKDRCFFTDFFSEGAVFFRASMLHRTGGYDADFFQYSESVDLSLRFIRDGVDLLFCPFLGCAELRIRGVIPRQRTRINYLSLRNKLWIAWKHYPLWSGFWYACSRLGIALVRSCRYRWLDYFLAGAWHGVLAPSSIRKKRRPLSPEVWDRRTVIRTGHECNFAPGPANIPAASANVLG